MRWGRRREPLRRANAIVTFTAPRPAHVFSMLTRGPTCIADIGSPPRGDFFSLQLNVITRARFCFAGRAASGRIEQGKLWACSRVGGPLVKAGSVAMAGMAALRAGAGLSTVATAKSALATVAGFPSRGDDRGPTGNHAGTISASAGKSLRELSKGKSVLAIGPGISREPETAELVRSLVSESEIPDGARCGRA